MIQALQLLLSLSILVVLHEFGHYITAKMFGCRVEKFYLFMDWPIALFKKKIGETEFGIGCAPLGGYVKISGMVDESMDTDGLESAPQPWELRAKPAWQRLIVMLGGIFVNIILAWFIFSMMTFAWGDKRVPMESLKDGFTFSSNVQQLGFEDGDRLISIDTLNLAEYNGVSLITSLLFKSPKEVVVDRDGKRVVIQIKEDVLNDVIGGLSREVPPLDPRKEWLVSGFSETSFAQSSGMEIGDRIVSINDVKTPYYSIKAKEEMLLHKNDSVRVVVERAGETKFLDIKLDGDGLLGTLSSPGYTVEIIDYSFLNSFGVGLTKTVETMDLYWAQMKAIFNPKTGGYKHVGGFISIGQMFPDRWHWPTFWFMTAFLSIILAIMNLLPIPALDGGHAVIALGEMITGKRLPLKILMPLQIVGMVILFALIIYANGNDIVNLFK